MNDGHDPTRRVLLGVGWVSSKPDGASEIAGAPADDEPDGGPVVRLRDDDEPASRLVAAAGLALNYRLDAEPVRRCVGHVPFRSSRGDYYDCDRMPEQGKRTCGRCAIVDATFASNLHHAHTRGMAELDPAIRSHLQQPNRLYLAAFRDGSIKVGTSTVGRSHKRLAEQGAWMARFVAETTDGLSVRSLEDLVTEVWSLPQSVSARRKISGLVDPLGDAELDARLDEAATRVGELMARTPDDRVTPLVGIDVTGQGSPGAASRPGQASREGLERAAKRVEGSAELHDRSPDQREEASDAIGMLGEPWRHPMAGHPALAKVREYPLALTSGRHELRVLTAIGRILLARRIAADGQPGPDVFAIDPARLFGIELDIGNYGSDEIAIQDSLF